MLDRVGTTERGRLGARAADATAAAPSLGRCNRPQHRERLDHVRARSDAGVEQHRAGHRRLRRPPAAWGLSCSGTGSPGKHLSKRSPRCGNARSTWGPSAGTQLLGRSREPWRSPWGLLQGSASESSSESVGAYNGWPAADAAPPGPAMLNVPSDRGVTHFTPDRTRMGRPSEPIPRSSPRLSPRCWTMRPAVEPVIGICRPVIAAVSRPVSPAQTATVSAVILPEAVSGSCGLRQPELRRDLESVADRQCTTPTNASPPP